MFTPGSVSLASIKIDLSRDNLLDNFAKETLTQRYLIKGETSPQHAFARASAAFADDKDHAQRIYDYVSRLWFMFATPLLSNGGTVRGLPISCFLNWVPDSREGILAHYTENGWLASMGGGIGSYWGKLRGKGEKTKSGSSSTGVIPFTKVVDAQMLAFNQGDTRRGSAAVYLDVSHPEIEEWIVMRRETGGDANRKTLNLHHGVCLTNEFMIAVQKKTSWDLISPKTGLVVKTVSAEAIWEAMLAARIETGEPYFFFTDTANAALNPLMKAAGFHIPASNLCTEIMLPFGPDPLDQEMRTAVCCLSSTNLALWDDWKHHPLFIEDLMRMLDNALEVFCQQAGATHAAAVRSAQRERSVGLGAMGFHTYLQGQNVALESAEGRRMNREIFKKLDELTLRASRALAEERGSPRDIAGSGERFAHRMAIAPNATSSIICGGVSPGTEPRPTNAVLQKTLSGSFQVKNPDLQRILLGLGKDTHDVWADIIQNKGSVQHLSFLTDHQKNVFRTAFEMDQMNIVRLAADRQEYIDQGQSVNLFFPNNVKAPELHRVHMGAWVLGLKSLYYLRTEAVRRAALGSLATERKAIEPEVCLACEG